MNREQLVDAINRELSALPWWDRPDEETSFDGVPDDMLLELLEDLTGSLDV